MKIWVSESESIEIGDSSLYKEFAPRSQSVNWMGLEAFLPDPDPILRKMGQDMTVYKQLLSDAHVWGCYQARKAGVLSQEWELVSGISTSREKDCYGFINEVMKNIDVHQATTEMLESPFFGMSPIEISWVSKSGRWVPGNLTGKPPEWFVFDSENKLRFLSKDSSGEGMEVPLFKFLLPRHQATYENPYGSRVLSRCFWPVTFKKGGFKFWSIFTEKFGMANVVGKVPRSTSDTDRSILLANLASMVQDAVAVINDDESIEFVEASGKGASSDIYDRLIEVCNKEISKAILGQTATTEGTPGKLGNEEGQIRTKDNIIEMDKMTVSNTWNTLFQWIVRLNFEKGIAPVLSLFEEDNRQKSLSVRDDNLVKQGIRFSKEYYMKSYKLDEDDFLIEENRP